jgi:MoaA/NifB/PqqE/SkfB family radical SAM enzyme
VKMSINVKRIEYLPWSKATLEKCIEISEHGGMPILDIELTSKCSHGACIYCDSQIGPPDLNELSLNDYHKLIEMGCDYGLQWVHICGIGEPSDFSEFINLIKYLHQKQIGVSLFTNTLNFTKEIIEILYTTNTCLIIKMDSFNGNVFDKILGKKGSANRIYENIKLLLDIGYPTIDDQRRTRLAFSIVPMRTTVNEIIDVISFCKENGIYPSIGELEHAGKGIQCVSNMGLSNKELLLLRQKVEETLGHEYRRPVCPALFTGLHLNNKGDCIVHKDTGLNCGWFLLQEPNYQKIGNIKELSLHSLNKLAKACRKTNANQTIALLENQDEKVFGGCGGSAKKILEYLSSICSTT